MNLKMESSEQEFQELQQKRAKELIDARAKILAETTAKAKKFQLYYTLVELILGIGGYLIIGFMVSWWLVLGLYLVNWSINMNLRRVMYQDTKRYLKRNLEVIKTFITFVP